MYKKGFTLIELLVVISIVSLLSSVIFSAVEDARAKARDTKRLVEIRELITALNLYYQENGGYPASCGNNWSCLGHSDGRDGGRCWQSRYSGCSSLDSQISPYISHIPDDPVNDTSKYGDAYMYRTNYTNNNFGLSNIPAVIHWGLEKKPASNEDCGPGGLKGTWASSAGGADYCLIPLY